MYAMNSNNQLEGERSRTYVGTYQDLKGKVYVVLKSMLTSELKFILSNSRHLFKGSSLHGDVHT